MPKSNEVDCLSEAGMLAQPDHASSPLPSLEGRAGDGCTAAVTDARLCHAPPPQPLPAGEGLSDPIFTPALKLRFLDELSQHGNVRVAVARIGVSRSGLYLARRRDAAFAAGWVAALREARWHAEAVLAERALDGVEEQVFYRGEVIAVRRRYDTRLLLAHLARLDALCAEPGADAPFDAALASAAGLAATVPQRDRAGHLEEEAERAGMRFDHAEPLPCIDSIERELAHELDAIDDDAAREARIDEAYDAAETAFQAARGKQVSAAVARAAQTWDKRHAAFFAEIDALRAAPPFEVKGLGDTIGPCPRPRKSCFMDPVQCVQSAHLPLRPRQVSHWAGTTPRGT